MESLAVLWQSATLLVHGEDWIARAFVNARLADRQYHQYGTLDRSTDAKAIVERARPAVTPLKVNPAMQA